MTPGGAEPPEAPPAGSKLPRVVVASLGNEYRRDDGAGQVVAARLVDRARGVVNVGPRVDPLDLLGCWDNADLAIVIDATRSDQTPGTVQVVDLSTTSQHPGATSTHGISLAGVLRLAQAVGRAPARVIVVGIEGDDFGNGAGLSPAVRAAVPVAVGKVLELIGEPQPCA
jgi:hydrogenase maturation protease